MKLHHYSLIFVIISLSFLVLVNVETRIYEHVVEEKDYLDQVVAKAIDDAMVYFSEEETDMLQINKERAVSSFLDSMCAALNIDASDKEELEYYIPLMSVITMDGFYVYFTGEHKNNINQTYYKKQWSEKHPFYYEDEDFIYKFTLTDTLIIYDKNGLLDQENSQRLFVLNASDFIFLDKFADFRKLRPSSFLLKEEDFYEIRKNTITSSIENVLKEYCYKHNEITNKLGISYMFHLPSTSSEMSKSIESSSLLVLIQGYPLKSSQDTVFNRFSLSISQSRKRQLYVIEEGTYPIYHKKDCSKLLISGDTGTEAFYSIKEAVATGAFPCEECSYKP